MSSTDSNSNEGASRRRRRSSIFKNSYSKNLSQTVNNETNFPQECKESLEYEKNEWKFVLQKLRDKHQGLKLELVERKETIKKADLPVEELEFFDDTFYRDYLQSVQNVCTKLECLIEEKEQQDIMMEERRKLRLNLMKK